MGSTSRTLSSREKVDGWLPELEDSSGPAKETLVEFNVSIIIRNLMVFQMVNLDR